MDDLLLSPGDESTTLTSILTPDRERTTQSTAPNETPANKTQAHLSTSSTALHTDLSAQLLQMSTQLKRNALHFSSSLAEDNAVVSSAQEQIETNYTSLSQSRTKLRDYSKKSGWGGTTGIVWLSLVVVGVSFVMMFLLIRIT